MVNFNTIFSEKCCYGKFYHNYVHFFLCHFLEIPLFLYARGTSYLVRKKIWMEKMFWSKSRLGWSQFSAWCSCRSLEALLYSLSDPYAGHTVTIEINDVPLQPQWEFKGIQLRCCFTQGAFCFKIIIFHP